MLAQVPEGKIKSFGPFEPKYKAGRALRQIAGGDWMVEVIIVETGEMTEYRMTHLMNGPETL